MKLRGLCVILGVLMIALLFPYSAVADWQIECVDCPRHFDRVSNRSLALDSSGNPHIVYASSIGVYYAYYDGVSWHIETVDSGGDVITVSIAIDSSDNVHISYDYEYVYDSFYNPNLKYATNASGSWVTETIDSSIYSSSPSIAIDSSDNVHISYSSPGLKYATNASGSWVTETVESSGGGSSSIAIDSSDNVHISYDNYYYPNYNLKYATNASGSWVTETIDSLIYSSRPSIAIDSSDKVHISYVSYDSGLKYATNASGSWVTETIDSEAGFHNSIAIDSSDNVHIIYGNLKYATNATGSWVTETVDSSFRAASIAIDYSDNVHISYISNSISNNGYFTTSDLKYALNSSGSWVIETVDSSRRASVAAAVIDLADNVHTTYFGPQGLMYRTNASGSWVIETVDGGGGDTRDASIAVDSSDNVHIIYEDGYYPNYDLKYATNASGSWVSETIASGRYGSLSIAIDSSDNVHISYVSYDSGLKYATNASGSWVTVIVDSGRVRSPSIAVDSSDNVHIIYEDDDYYYNHNLKYATNASGSWLIEIIDFSLDSTYPSIAIDSSDNVHISYGIEYLIEDEYAYEYYNTVKYATNASGSWVTETVSGGNSRSIVAIDSSDNVHISYGIYSPYNYNLKYATNASGSWVTETVAIDGGAVSMAIDSSDYVHIIYYDGYKADLMYATNKPLPDISVTDSIDPADDLLIPFGEITECSLSKRTVTVTNTGDANLVIGEVYLTGANQDQFNIKKDRCSGAAILPSGSCTTDVVFSPTEAGEWNAFLGIESNDPDTPTLYVELTGTGIQRSVYGRGMHHSAPGFRARNLSPQCRHRGHK